ncbi:MAG: hypothetical protein RIR11_5 [Bacteroidota bacterium]
MFTRQYWPTFAADSNTMRDKRLFQLFLFFVLVHWAAHVQAQDRFVPRQMLVALAPGAAPGDFLPLQEGGNENKWKIIRKVTSNAANIWLLELNTPNHEAFDAEQWLKNQPVVLTTQLNHYVQQRDTEPTLPPNSPLQELKLVYPNDPLFATQWHIENTGQLNGTSGVDLGMIDAWEMTTGGISPTGDTVVVAVIDGGICPSCPDWGNNIWKNSAEIPNDGLDNDGNGFVDDYKGWNVIAQNDDILGYSTGHGSSVSGIIAAKGNNNIGITGMMWDTKLMFVAALNGPNTTEAEVLAAYDYVYTARKAYNESHGKNGAFVVAVNCSFGINFVMAYQSPLWCNILDQLGEIGILTVGSTANGNWNVDIVGDIPTTCPSDYLISVTGVDNKDQKAANVAWGSTSVDLGAFSKDIYTLLPGSPAYDYRSGTSYAAPQVSGALGLLYTAACKNLTVLAKQNPAAAALWAKNLMLESVLPNVSLDSITVTGGRLKVDDMLHHYQDQCQSCLSPFWLSIDTIGANFAVLNWLEGAASSALDLRWKDSTAINWTHISNVQSPYVLQGLNYCTTYEFAIRAHCDSSLVSNWSPSKSFKTDGCCIAPSISSIKLDSLGRVSISWNPIIAALSYTIRYKSSTSSEWIYVQDINSTELLLENLPSCTSFSVEIQTNCDGGPTTYAPALHFDTKGCGACYDHIYCEGKSENAMSEWIKEVAIGGFWNNASSGNQGYQFFSSQSTPLNLVLTPNMATTATVTPGFMSSSYQEMFRIYVDFNLDGDFEDANELAFDPAFSHNGAMTAPFMTPNFQEEGITRMRVMMKYKPTSALSLPQPCEVFPFGQVEDYCVTLSLLSVPSLNVEDIDAHSSITIMPNPFYDQITIQIASHSESQKVKYELYDATGRIVRSAYSATNQKYIEVNDVGSLPQGIYWIKIAVEGANQMLSKLVKW